NGTSILKPVEGMKSLLPAAWYRLRFAARNWGEANACFDLQLSEPDGNEFTAPATRHTSFQDPVRAAGVARHFVLANSAGVNPGIDVQKVSLAAITPYKGRVTAGVDTKTLLGKVMCGYQGWFGAPGDGSSEHGWRHWTKNYGPLADGNAKVDLWPDVSELDASQRFKTDFMMADGRPAEVFSSFEKPTVLKHFEWMQDYGIDGVFVQRFANGLKNPATQKYCNTVLANCREAANVYGRTYAVMYDLSGLPAGHIDDVIDDWRALRKEMVITEDPAYLNHRGKPVVAVWGIGFNDGREYTLAECRRLIEFLKNDPEAGGCTVMLGVPTNWRELKDDAVNDPALLETIALADIVSPWTVGRYTNPDEAATYAEKIMKPDFAWCRQRGIDFLPVVFPGFSWHNMKDGPSNQIPRLHGQFLWSQFLAAKQADISMVYVAMFDEVDEGTAIFKCANEVPQGKASKFVTFEGLPSDYYLRMVGNATRLFGNKASSERNSPLLQN
ncbi:MAG TPA: glycoside hydrolase family 71/99-like protein, partial [Candidatus Acidoferrales bacterium]|nr:glycoside hydrolase family 71/99-like protein [Candidatus Acidoferrales bacterium]